MILHVVLLQPKPETTPEEIHHALELVKALQETISGILDIQVGENRHHAPQGFTHGFAITFATEDDLKNYFPHPEHRKVGPELRRICTQLQNFDLIQ
jgi:Stress responsive A/B Barrel Domain